MGERHRATPSEDAREGRHTSGITTALIVRYVRARGGEEALERVLEAAGEDRGAEVLEDESIWSTYEQKIALFEAAARVFSDPLIARRIGASATQHRVGTGLKVLLRGVGSPGLVLKGIARAAPKFSTVCSMKAVDVQRANAVVTYELHEGFAPHRMDCDYNRGLLSQVSTLFGLPPAAVWHSRCQVDGTDRCVYRVSWATTNRFRRGRDRIADLESRLAMVMDRGDALQSTIADLISPDDLDQLLPRIAARAATAVQAPAYLIAVRYPDAETDRVHYEGLNEADAESLAQRIFQEGAELGDAILVAEIASARCNYGRLAAVNRDAAQPFFPEEKRLLATYARQAAVALDMADAFARVKAEQQTLRVLLDLARSLAVAGTVEDVAQRVVDAVPTVLGVSRAAMLLWDDEAKLLRPIAARGFSDEMARSLLELHLSPADSPLLADHIGEPRGAFYNTDSIDDPFARSVLETFEVATIVSAPMVVGDRLLGAVAAVRGPDEPPLSDDQATRVRLEGLAGEATTALERTRLVEVERDANQKLAEQARILEMIASGEPLKAILDELASTIEHHSEGVCSILLLDESGQVLRHGAAPSLPESYTSAIDGLVIGPEVGSCGSAAFRGETVVVTDTYTDPKWAEFRDLVMKHGLRSCWSMPIFGRRERRVLGTFAMYYDTVREPSQDDWELLTMSAHLAAVAIERKDMEKELLERAFQDPLTKLPNRLLFTDRIQHALDRADRRDELVALVWLDVDGFKEINETLGRAVGDEMLVAIADRLSAALRPADSCARLGSDEFTFLFEDTSESDALRIAERMQEILSAPFVIQGRELTVTASIGISVAAGGAEVDVEELMRNADAALYAAKRRGKGGRALFESGMRRAMVDRIELRSDLQRALENGDLLLHYQPIVELATGRIEGVEALVRWDHPERGLLSPDDFIAVAEESGQILDIDRWVLHQATAQIRDFQQRVESAQGLTIHVNLSARQFDHPRLVPDVKEALEHSGLDPACLTLELTEGVIMADTEATRRRLTSLKQLGVMLAVDDFGTGYSSLSYLRRFPVDVLKIDKFFIHGIGRGPEDSALARAVVKLAQTLDLAAVAEGIETEGQLEYLRELHCDSGQGFFFSKPVDATRLERLLAERPLLVSPSSIFMEP